MASRTRRSVFTTLFATLLLVLPAFSAAQRQCSDPSSTLLWEVKGKNSTVYLFGSLHLGNPGFYPLPEKIETTFRNADHIVLEVDPRSAMTMQTQSRMLQMGSLAPGEKLSDLLSPEVINDLEARLGSMGLPPENFLNFRPWFITLMLTSLQYTSLGYLPNHGVEFYVLREAPEDTTILELETLDEQLSYFQHLDGEAFLAYTLASFEEGRQMASDLVEAWRCADKAALVALLNQGFEVEGPLAAEMENLKNTLIIERNQKMAAKIRGYLQNGQGSYFVVVGSAHYLGEGSIIELLRNKGYEVNPVRL